MKLVAVECGILLQQHHSLQQQAARTLEAQTYYWNIITVHLRSIAEILDGFGQREKTISTSPDITSHYTPTLVVLIVTNIETDPHCRHTQQPDYWKETGLSNLLVIWVATTCITQQ